MRSVMFARNSIGVSHSSKYIGTLFFVEAFPDWAQQVSCPDRYHRAGGMRREQFGREELNRLGKYVTLKK